MRTSILPLVVSALVLPGCTLVFNQERYWRDGGGVAVDAGVDANLDAFVVPDAFMVPDANLDAFAVPDAFMRPMPTVPGPQRTVSLSCSAAPSIVFEDLGDGRRGVVQLVESFASFPGWRSFAMLANTVQIGSDEVANTIPSHAIWMDAMRIPHLTWLEPSGTPGVLVVAWGDGEAAGNRRYMSGGSPTAFVRANAERFIAGGGESLIDCTNIANPACTPWATGLTGAKWGGFVGGRVVRAYQNGMSVGFPESSTSMGYVNSGPLRQVTGAAGGLYSNADPNSNLFRFDFTVTPYSVTAVPLGAGDVRVSHDGTGYLRATIDAFNVTVSTCTTTCADPRSTAISLSGEALVDWNFHALEGGVRVAVLLTRAAAAPTSGTHVSVATWREGDERVIPLRIATGRFPAFQGRGRSIESVAELSGGQLDVYVSTLVNAVEGPTNEDRIYLSGFRLCL